MTKGTGLVFIALHGPARQAGRPRARRGPRRSAKPRLWIYDRICISFTGGSMQVAKWGNSLAVRLPATVVEALDLKEGDQIEIRIAGEREFEVTRDRSKDKALARLRRL